MIAELGQYALILGLVMATLFSYHTYVWRKYR